MAAIGINIRRDGSDLPATVKGLNATWVRIVLMRDHDLRERFSEYRAAGIRVLGLVARESLDGFSSEADALAYYARTYTAGLSALQVGNESDLESPSSWDMTQADLMALGRLARAVFPSTRLVCAGMASGHPEYLDGADLSWCDAVACHPYLKDAPNPSDLEDLADIDVLVRAYQQYGKPVVVSEYGWWDDAEPRASQEVGDAVKWAATTLDCLVFFYFCLDDGMVPPFGLLHADGSEKPRAAPFRKAAKNAVEVPWLPVVSIPTPVPVIYRTYARSAATGAGIDPEMFVRQIQQESGFRPDALNAGSGATGIAQIIKRWHPDVDPTDPIASLDYAATWMGQLYRQYGSYARALAAYNWGPGNVAGWDGTRATLPAETRHYLDVILGPFWEGQVVPATVVYNRDEPAVAQNDPWSCAPTSTRWALRAVGRNPSEAWLEETMIAEGVVSEQDGLLDSSGKALAAFISRQYGEHGYTANNEQSVSFDAVAREIGPYPLLIGGRRWGSGGHWSGVRSYDAATGLLHLANPSAGWGGIGQTLSRTQWDQIGPVSMVRVLHPDLLAATPPAPDPVPMPPSRAAVLVAEIQERVDELAALVA